MQTCLVPKALEVAVSLENHKKFKLNYSVYVIEDLSTALNLFSGYIVGTTNVQPLPSKTTKKPFMLIIICPFSLLLFYLNTAHLSSISRICLIFIKNIALNLKYIKLSLS